MIDCDCDCDCDVMVMLMIATFLSVTLMVSCFADISFAVSFVALLYSSMFQGHDDECAAAAWASDGSAEVEGICAPEAPAAPAPMLPASDGVGDLRLFKHRISAGTSAAAAAAGRGDVFVNHNVCTFVAGMMHHASQMMMVNRFIIIAVETMQPRSLLSFVGSCCSAALISPAPCPVSALVASRACPTGFAVKGGAAMRRAPQPTAAPQSPPHLMTWTRQMMKVAFYSEVADIAAVGAAWPARGNMMRIYLLEEETAELLRALKWAHTTLPPSQRYMGAMPMSLLPLEEE